MTSVVETEILPDMLRLTISGTAAPAEMLTFIVETKEIAVTSKRTNVLVDCRGLDVELTETDRFQCGLRVADVFGSRYKVAVIMPAGKVTKMGELAAVNRGARMLVTESSAEAESWLLYR